MSLSQDFKSVQERIQAALVKATRTANQIASEDLGFQRTLDRSIGEQLDGASSRLLHLSNVLLETTGKPRGLTAPSLDDVDDIDLRWRSIVDIVDSLLEKADTSLDEYTGLLKRKDAPAPVSVRGRSTAATPRY